MEWFNAENLFSITTAICGILYILAQIAAKLGYNNISERFSKIGKFLDVIFANHSQTKNQLPSKGSVGKPIKGKAGL